MLLLIALSASASATADEQVIKSLRLENDRALQVRDAKAFASLWAPHFVLIESDGTLYRDPPALLKSYEDVEFKDAGFVTYDREPDAILIARDRKHAAERGHWTALRRDGKRTRSGVYLASWIKTASGWRIAWESYISLR